LKRVGWQFRCKTNSLWAPIIEELGDQYKVVITGLLQESAGGEGGQGGAVQCPPPPKKKHTHRSSPVHVISATRGLQRDVVYLSIVPSYINPNAGGRGGGGVAGSQLKSTAVHRSPNKLWRSYFIFNLCP
jgi:hypothetical protein